MKCDSNSGKILTKVAMVNFAFARRNFCLIVLCDFFFFFFNKKRKKRKRRRDESKYLKNINKMNLTCYSNFTPT